MIEFTCSNCGLAIRATDDKAGRPGKCPKCGSHVQMPGKLHPPGVVPGAVGGAAASSRAEPLHADRPEGTQAVACDVCGAQCAGESGVSCDEMREWAQAGFSPLARIAPSTCQKPSVLYPRFAHVMWYKTVCEGKAGWHLCQPCREASGACAANPIGVSADGSDAHPWLKGIIEECVRNGAQQIPAPAIDKSNDISQLGLEFAQTAIQKEAGYESLEERRKGFLAAFATHGERFGFAAATALAATTDLTASYPQLDVKDILAVRRVAADALAQWDDPRGTDLLINALHSQDGMLVGRIAEMLMDKREPRAFFDALLALSTLLGIQHKSLQAMQEGGFRASVPLSSDPGDIDKAFVKCIAEKDRFTALTAGIGICWLIRLISRTGGEVGHKVLQEICAFSLFDQDVICSADELHTYDCAEDQSAIAITVARQPHVPGEGAGRWGQLEYLVRHSSPAGWWAMERFCGTAGEWLGKHVPTVREFQQRIPRPPDDVLACLERAYGPFVDAEKARRDRRIAKAGGRKPAGQTPCFVATAAWGTEQAADVVCLRAFRDRVLVRRAIGRLLVRVYERVSPSLADRIRRSEFARWAVRKFIVSPAARYAARVMRERDTSLQPSHENES